MVVLEIAHALVTGAIALSFGFVAFVWLATAIVGLVRALLRAPFSREARADLLALQFLRHPLLAFGPRQPTARMRELALRVAQERGIPLPKATLCSFHRTRRFLNDHSRDWLPTRRW
ncbi:hypothetical protein HT749_15625 [Burkholderia cepacia]|uniref:hypothetical protein n=1 Tax=Burkholderia cepacia TaxID=292 RepID=UPI00157A34FD|nr:hypothetical protein [Burkholderia cepacia]NTX44836.1 hypothetical protein [Burkholderia cepacia]